jgi:glycogen operon protein
MQHPQALQLVMDSLRYWVVEMHVDGFRFDLAATLARELYEVDRLSAFFDIVHQDPVLNRVKLIAEPWDVGEGGYQVGNFPVLWCEWNGKYRDVTRGYWRSQDATLGEFAARLTGSSDLYQDDGRKPYASINFITAHDGFTLRDLASYNDKHNEANGEDNLDGDNHNLSWNMGVEGPTDDEAINAARARQQRNFLATLFLSQGVPMLLAGDEIGRTQRGNNNAYCQDNDMSWLDWAHTDDGLLDFTRQLIAFRQSHPVFRRRRWFKGVAHDGVVPDIAWFNPDGQEMSEQNWHDALAKSFMMFLNGDALRSRDRQGKPVCDDTFLLLFNSSRDPVTFTLPAAHWGDHWKPVLATESGFSPDASSHGHSSAVERPELSLQVFRRQ